MIEGYVRKKVLILWILYSLYLGNDLYVFWLNLVINVIVCILKIYLISSPYKALSFFKEKNRRLEYQFALCRGSI